ncbi:hypothetical protein SODALDRAFT_71961 [Sodiomyces alkalinus F11]|uniref:Uncharacterized protein n=1 Tax=Sodiomyces alkalinus (strain CBS 110278 / VKM F-3762 / F11) TaxID=1314773 RepID=A0A3N2PMV3_SODAK|nr:hypothetical protein SODALDRAFT_71961 [Sodiomyces alkalinus F11]ROT35666.1 hypothetical protein SODALDRAFT_71961 [Sodiomyces alkalinus F11]
MCLHAASRTSSYFVIISGRIINQPPVSRRLIQRWPFGSIFKIYACENQQRPFHHAGRWLMFSSFSPPHCAQYSSALPKTAITRGKGGVGFAGRPADWSKFSSNKTHVFQSFPGVFRLLQFNREDVPISPVYCHAPRVGTVIETRASEIEIRKKEVRKRTLVRHRDVRSTNQMPDTIVKGRHMIFVTSSSTWLKGRGWEGGGVSSKCKRR